MDKFDMVLLIQFKMSQRAGTIFISGQDQKESFEEPFDDNNGYDDNDEDSNPHKIMDDHFQGLLEADEESKEEAVLKFKVVELQKICNSLTNTNRRLINRVAALEQEKEKQKKQEIFVDEYSELNGEFTQVEDLISEYKKYLNQLQKNVLSDLKLKEQQIENLKEQLTISCEKYDDLRLEKQEIQKLNRQLQTRNEGLILQIQGIQREKSQIQQKMRSNPRAQNRVDYNNMRSYDSSFIQEELSTQIQIQYENLIDKLVQQLEYERNMKKKMAEEIKRLTGQLRNSQKQIMEKNRKLYQVQMKWLKSSKATTSQSSIHRPPRFETERYQGRVTNSKTQRSAGNQIRHPSSFSTFLVLELINGEVETEISPENRKIIGHKIMQFYERKLSKQDFSNVMPDNLLVSNYTAKKPELLIIRKTGNSVYEDGQKTEQSLIWNMAFILDNLFGQGQQVEAFDEILELTGQMLEKQVANNRDSLESIKRLLIG